MARRNNNDGTKELAWILTICTLGAFFLIKWAIEAIVWLFKAIAQLIVWIANRAEKKKNVNADMPNASELVRQEPAEDKRTNNNRKRKNTTKRVPAKDTK